MEDKQQQLVKKFNQLRIELGDVVYQQSILAKRQESLTSMLEATQALYEKAVKSTPPSAEQPSQDAPGVSDTSQNGSIIVQDAPGDVVASEPAATPVQAA